MKSITLSTGKVITSEEALELAHKAGILIEEESNPRKELDELDELLDRAIEYIPDLVSDFLYYNRKEDDNFTRADAQRLMTHPDASIRLAEAFRLELEDAFPQ